MSDRDWNRFDHLAATHVLGLLSEPEATELSALLRDDTAAQVRFARFCRQEMVIRQALAMADQRMGPGTEAVVQAIRQTPGSGTGRHARSTAPRTHGGSGRHAARTSKTGRVHRRANRRAIPFPLAIGAVAAALLVLVTLVVAWNQQTGIVNPASASSPLAWQWVTGSVDLRGDTEPQAGAALASPATIVVGNDGSGTVRHADGSLITLLADSRAQLTDTASGLQVRMDHGTARYEVAPQTDGRTFTVVTPHGDVTVIGTRFLVTVDADGTTVDVNEGRVRVRDALTNELSLLIGGDMALLGPTEPATASVPDTPSNAPSPVDDVLIRSLAIVDAEHDVVVPGFTACTDGATIPIEALPSRAINIRIATHPRVAALRIHVDGQAGNDRLEHLLPFSVFTDTDGNYRQWHVEPGTLRLRLACYADFDGRVAIGEPIEWTLHFVENGEVVPRF